MSLVQPMYAQVRSPRTLSLVAVGGLSAAFVVGLGLTVLQIYAYGVLADASAGVAQTQVAALLLLAGGLIDVVVLLFSGIAFLCWLYRVRSNLDAFPMMAFQWRRGWAIGAWFVPIANLFIPLGILGEVDRATERQARQPRRATVYVLWAVFWTAYVIVDRVSAVAYSSRIGETVAERAESLNGQLTFVAISGVLGLLAAVFAILLVRRITEHQDAVLMQPVYAAPASYGQPQAWAAPASDWDPRSPSEL
jgi:hypothetical protein